MTNELGASVPPNEGEATRPLGQFGLERRTVLAGAATAALAATTSAVAAQRPPAASGRLAGKVAFVTGAARGIGRASAITLAREGADVALFDLTAAVGSVPYALSTPADLKAVEQEVLSRGRRCLSFRGDVRDMGALRRAVAETSGTLGSLDIVHANAGVLSFAPLTAMTDEQWSANIDVNLTGAANTLRAAIPVIRAGNRGGRVIVTSSDLARRGLADLSHYCASKWGVIGLVKAAAQELAPHMITVNAICPGATRTPMQLNEVMYRRYVPGSANPVEAEVTAAVRTMNIRNRELPIAWVEPEDIAEAVLFLASNEGRFVTGTALDVTAGKSSHYSA